MAKEICVKANSQQNKVQLWEISPYRAYFMLWLIPLPGIVLILPAWKQSADLDSSHPFSSKFLCARRGSAGSLETFSTPLSLPAEWSLYPWSFPTLSQSYQTSSCSAAVVAVVLGLLTVIRCSQSYDWANWHDIFEKINAISIFLSFTDSLLTQAKCSVDRGDT